MGRLVVVGGLNMDIHLFGLRESVGQAPLIASHHLAEPGGKAGNVARAAARMGAAVTLVARVGADDFGHDCVAAAAADGVDVSGVVSTPDQPTGFVAIRLDEGKHRSLVFSPGANAFLAWDDVAPHVAGLSPTDIVARSRIVMVVSASRPVTSTVARPRPLVIRSSAALDFWLFAALNQL